MGRCIMKQMQDRFAREQFAEWFDAQFGESKKQKSKGQLVFLVAGAPGAGKTTYVQKKKCKGDLVVDLDTLAAALQGVSDPHPDYKTVMDAVLAAREAIYHTIENRSGTWENAYVITSNPNPFAVNELAKRLDAKLVYIKPSEQECCEQVKNDHTRLNKANDLRLVAEWYKLNS